MITDAYWSRRPDQVCAQIIKPYWGILKAAIFSLTWSGRIGIFCLAFCTHVCTFRWAVVYRGKDLCDIWPHLVAHAPQACIRTITNIKGFWCILKSFLALTFTLQCMRVCACVCVCVFVWCVCVCVCVCAAWTQDGVRLWRTPEPSATCCLYWAQKSTRQGRCFQFVVCLSLAFLFVACLSLVFLFVALRSYLLPAWAFCS